MWPLGYFYDVNPGFQIAEWILNLVYAYDYLRASEREGGPTIFSTAERSTLDTWFYHAADYWSHDLNSGHDSALGTSRWNEPPTYNTAPLSSTEIYLHDGSQTYSAPAVSRYYNNRKAQLARMPSLAAVMLEQDGFTPPSANPGRSLAWLRKSGRLFTEEYLKFATSPAPSWWGDSDRWTTSLPQLGLLYGVAVIGSMLDIANAEARTGNNSIFEYSTRYGQHGSATTFDKNLRFVIEEFQKYVREEYNRYGSDNLSNNSDYYKLMIRTPDGNMRVKDAGIAHGIIYYDDPLMQSTLRRESGPNTWPSNPHEPAFGFEGDTGQLPASLFMFEGTGVNPYV
jgi:hypothetical protein